MSRIALVLFVVLFPLAAARAQIREPSCPTFAAMTDTQR